jgi:hypothetical protein
VDTLQEKKARLQDCVLHSNFQMFLTHALKHNFLNFQVKHARSMENPMLQTFTWEYQVVCYVYLQENQNFTKFYMPLQKKLYLWKQLVERFYADM